MAGVAWHPPVQDPQPGSLAHYAVVTGRDGRCRFLLDLLTGSRDPFSLEGTHVDFWREGTVLSATDDGLAVSNLRLPEEVLILTRGR